MLSPVDERLREEARRFRLRFACSDCLHAEPETRRCSLAFPEEARPDEALEHLSALYFCKCFELA